MSNMRKATVFGVVLSLVSLLLTVGPETAMATKGTNAKVFTKRDRQEHSAGKPVTVSKIQLDLGSDGISVTGELVTSESTVPFHFSGPLLQSSVHSDRALVKAEDQEGNFDAVFLALERNRGVAPFFFNAKKPADAMLRIYLLEKSTQDFFALEIDHPNVRKEILENWHLVEQVPTAPMEADLWHSRAFDPVSFEEIDLSAPEQTASDSAIGAQSTGQESDRDTKLYRIVYYISGDQVYEDFKVSHWLNCEANIPLENEGTCRSGMDVVEERTWSPDNPNYEANVTNTRLEEVEAVHATDTGQAVVSANYGGRWQGGGGLSVDLSVGLSLTLPGLPIGISLSGSADFPHQVVERPLSYTNPDYYGNYVREHGFRLDDGDTLDYWDPSSTHELSHSFTQEYVVHSYSDPGSKAYWVEFHYRVVNPNGSYSGSLKSVRLIAVYNS